MIAVSRNRVIRLPGISVFLLDLNIEFLPWNCSKPFRHRPVRGDRQSCNENVTVELMERPTRYRCGGDEFSCAMTITMMMAVMMVAVVVAWVVIPVVVV